MSDSDKVMLGAVVVFLLVILGGIYLTQPKYKTGDLVKCTTCAFSKETYEIVKHRKMLLFNKYHIKGSDGFVLTDRDEDELELYVRDKK
jgi:hypothetical protein